MGLICLVLVCCGGCGWIARNESLGEDGEGGGSDGEGTNSGTDGGA